MIKACSALGNLIGPDGPIAGGMTATVTVRVLQVNRGHNAMRRRTNRVERTDSTRIVGSRACGTFISEVVFDPEPYERTAHFHGEYGHLGS